MGDPERGAVKRRLTSAHLHAQAARKNWCNAPRAAVGVLVPVGSAQGLLSAHLPDFRSPAGQCARCADSGHARDRDQTAGIEREQTSTPARREPGLCDRVAIKPLPTNDIVYRSRGGRCAFATGAGRFHVVADRSDEQVRLTF